MKKKPIGIRIPEEGLYLTFLKRLASCEAVRGDIIKFPRLFSKIGSSFQLNKKQIWSVLYFLNDLGFIKIVCGHGIRLNYSLPEEHQA